jgi:predicted nucleotidyltransferase
MASLRRVAAELAIPERTLRRAAAEGLVRGERVGARGFHFAPGEEAYLGTHWPLLRALRAALRTEPNVRLAVLFGAAATGEDGERSGIDVLVVMRDPDVRRLAGLAGRLSVTIAREVQPVRLTEAQGSPKLMLAAIERGRVLVDRDREWPRLRRGAGRWRRLARGAGRSTLDADGESTIEAMSPQSKSRLAREHLTRASGAFAAGDPVVGVTFLHLAVEAAIVALAELGGVATERQHWRKGQAAVELHRRGVLATDLSPMLELLNQARKDAGYEGEDPDFGEWTSEELVTIVEDAVHTAEAAAHAAVDETGTAQETELSVEGSTDTGEGSSA